MSWQRSLRRSQSSVASQRTFYERSDIASHISHRIQRGFRAKSIKQVDFDEEEEEHEEVEPYDPSMPKGRGEGLGLPQFLKDRRFQPRVADPMNDAFQQRLAAGSKKKGNPKAAKPIVDVFKLQQTGAGPLSEYSQKSAQPVGKPPKAVYVKKDRAELYDHKLQMKPFNWQNQKTAKQTLDQHLQKTKAKGELVDVGEAIKRQLVQKRDIMRNFDKSQTLNGMRTRDLDHVNPTQKIDEQHSLEIWDAFGRYLKKQLLAGKSTLIPKFGKFTYTFVNHLKMGGLTNPSQRDQQIRTPVFLVGKDFVYGIKMKPGIAGSWCHDVHLNDKKSQYSDTDLISRFTQSSIGGSKNHVIAFECSNNTGLLPTHDISYLDVALMAGNPKITRGVAKDHCELIFRKYADRAAAGYAVNANIPHIGKLSISIGICAVIFEKEIIEATRGNTIINYQDRYHPTDQPNNLMTNKILERDRNKTYRTTTGNRFSTSLGRSATLGQLKQQLDVEYEKKEGQKMSRGEQLSQFEVADAAAGTNPRAVERKELAAKVRVMERMANKRPGSAYGAKSVKSLVSFRSKDASQKALSRFSGSIAGSAISVVPDLEPGELLRIAQDIEQLKTPLVQKAQAQKIGLREILTSTKLQKLLQIVNYRIEIGHLKAFLKELNFNWNGASCSLMQLIEKVQKYVKNPLHDHEQALAEVQDLATRPKMTVKGRQGGGHDMPEDKDTLHKMLQIENDKTEPARMGPSLLQFIQDVFYNSGKSLHQIYSPFQIMDQRGKCVMLRESYMTLMRETMKDLISEEEIMLSYLMIPKAEEGAVTFHEFQKAFSVNDPARNVQMAVFPNAVRAEEEAKILKRVHEWMYKRQYDSAQAFERLLSSANRVTQRSLQRYELHKVAISEKIGLKESEIDFLFDCLNGYDKNQKEVHLKQWIQKVDNAPLDPLQQIRQVLKEKNLSQESVMKQLGLKLLDDPLDYKQFETAIRWFDSHMSDLQLQRLFTKLKDPAVNKVPVRKFLYNLTGTELDTVDAQKWMFKQLYERIYKHNKSAEFLKILEKADQNNDGLLSPVQVGFFLKYITGGDDCPFSDDQIEKFVRQLPRARGNTIVYVDFVKQIEAIGNKNHNPIRKIVKSIKDFMGTNKMTVTQLLERIEPLDGAKDGVPLEMFTKFLQEKIDKERDAGKLADYSNMIDIDKDGKICVDDLQTCIENIDSHQFFKNGGKYLKNSQFNNNKKFHQLPQKQLDREQNDQKLVEIRKQIEGALKRDGLNHKILFKRFDTDQDGMLNFPEFSKGIRSIITINQPTLEKIFNIMDHYKIGMIDYDQFVGFLKYEAPPIDLITHAEKQVYDEQNDPSRPLAEDSFEWQHDIVEKIRDWFRHERIMQRDLELTPLDAFKSFDIDFDGKVSSSDMKQALVSIVGIKASEVTQLRLDRLMKVISFFKTDTLQPSDFERLLSKKNPYEGPEAPLDAAENFKKSMGGALPTTDMHSWKMQAMQQIGQVLSRKFASCEDSFEEASQQTGKVNFEKFKTFIDKHSALHGFNMTMPLLQQLFGELDPHKKTYMNLKDWQNAFKTFNFWDQLVIEYKNQMQCIFVDCISAFEYYRTFNADDKEAKANRSSIDFDRFCQATKKIATGRNYSQAQLRYLFDLLLGGEGSLLKSFGLNEYKRFFGAAKFTGNQRLYQRKDKVLESIGRKGDDKKISKVQLMQSFGESILSRLRVLVQQSGKSLDDIFSQFDSDGSGELSRTEFRKALRAMNLGLTILEINEIIELVDKKDISNHSRYDLVQGDGKIDYDEFANKLYNMPANERRMLQRANDRLVLLKEQMILYMGSPTDAFRMFNKQKKGYMTFKEFEQLLNQLCQQSQEKMPKPDFTVVKDMFDAIDIGRDGLLDFREWTTSFQHLGVPESGHAFRPEPQTHGQKNAVKNTGTATQWMGGPEHAQIGACIAKNRHSLLKKFREHSTHTSFDGQPKYVTFPQAKKALDDLLHQNFVKNKAIQITDEKLACILEFGIIKKKLSSEQEKELPSFGPGYYEERPGRPHPYKDCLYDFTKLLDVYRDRYDLKVGIF